MSIPTPKSRYHDLTLDLDDLEPGLAPVLFKHIIDLLDRPDLGRVACDLTMDLQGLTNKQRAQLITFLESAWLSYRLRETDHD